MIANTGVTWALDDCRAVWITCFIPMPRLCGYCIVPLPYGDVSLDTGAAGYRPTAYYLVRSRTGAAGHRTTAYYLLRTRTGAAGWLPSSALGKKGCSSVAMPTEGWPEVKVALRC